MALTAACLTMSAAATAVGSGSRAAATREQSTQLISRARGGGRPNGPSTNAVISGDERYARVIAFQSLGSNLVRGDRDGVSDVFAVLRAGKANNRGTPWRSGRTVLLSRALKGQVANGPSFAPAVDGAVHHRASCVAFLSAASNLVRHDTNRKVDAFVVRLPQGRPRRVALPHGGHADTTQVAVSGDCKLVAFVNGGGLYVSKRGHVRRIRAPGPAADPSFSTGPKDDLVFGARAGVYLAHGGSSPRLVARGGSNPAYNDIRRHTIVYERSVGGHIQLEYGDLGHRARIVSRLGGALGNGDSIDPVIGDSGYYVTFQTTASNLGTSANGRAQDFNGQPDVYLYTDTRHITLVQSVREKAVPLPGGGGNPSMSFLANYILFNSPADGGTAQIYMRYLGGI